jgi:regulatory protein
MAGKARRGMAGARKPGGAAAAPAPAPALTATQLDNAALHYLGRFSSSSANLRRVLLRKVARAAARGADTSGAEALIDALIERYLASGLLDDHAYAAQTAVSLVRRGGSRYAIGGKLAQKGVAAELVKETLAGLTDAATSEIAAAAAFARRRRLGPYRSADRRAPSRQKDLASLARAGFRLDLARRVIDAPDIEALEALARGDED